MMLNLALRVKSIPNSAFPAFPSPIDQILTLCVLETDSLTISTQTELSVNRCFVKKTMLVLVDTPGDCCEQMMCENAVLAGEEG